MTLKEYYKPLRKHLPKRELRDELEQLTNLAESTVHQWFIRSGSKPAPSVRAKIKQHMKLRRGVDIEF